MKQIINEYIEKTETLIFADPENLEAKEFLKQLNILNGIQATLIEIKNNGIIRAIKLVFKVLADPEADPEKVMVQNNGFTLIVETIVLQNDAKEIKRENPHFDDSFYRIDEPLRDIIKPTLN